MTQSRLRQRLLEARPDLAQRVIKNARKRELALQLRALRRARGLMQEDVGNLSGLGRACVVQMEAPSGDLPSIEDLDRYVAACGGHMEITVSAKTSA
jgi:DNA-binding XRE family transcriptional regulator